MNELKFESIKAYGNQPGFEMEELKDAFLIKFTKNNLIFKITVAYDVVEWFIDIEEMGSGLKFHDWCDYADYDDSPKEKLTADMIRDLHKLFNILPKNEFRLIKRKNFLFFTHIIWERLVNGQWVQFDYTE
jgi:hypothetical protein